MTHEHIKQPLDSDQLVWLILQISCWGNLLFDTMNNFTEYDAINLWPAAGYYKPTLDIAGNCWLIL